MELTDDDVLEILKLFEQSTFEFLHLQQGERQITVSKSGYVPLGTTAAPVPAAPAAVAPSAVSKPAPKPAPKRQTLFAQFSNSGSWVTPRSSVIGPYSVRPGDLRLLLGSPPSRC